MYDLHLNSEHCSLRLVNFLFYYRALDLHLKIKSLRFPCESAIICILLELPKTARPIYSSFLLFEFTEGRSALTIVETINSIHYLINPEFLNIILAKFLVLAVD